VAGRGKPQGSERSRLAHLLDNWLIDGGEVDSLASRSLSSLKNDSWYSFLLEAEANPGAKRVWKGCQLKYPMISSGIELATRQLKIRVLKIALDRHKAALIRKL
jgi:hypothetical protein